MMFIFVSVLLVLTAEVTGRRTKLPNGKIHDVWDEYESVRGAPPLRSKKMLKMPEILWKRAAVIYKVHSNIGCPNSEMCRALMEAMSVYTGKTCVRFKEWSGEPDFVLIVMESLGHVGGQATVGKRRGKLFLRVHPKAGSKRVFLHELGHTLGLRHEHERPDRDHYVDFLRDNIIPEELQRFTRKQNMGSINLLGEPFDHKSIMMYGPKAYSKNGNDTLRLKSGEKLLRNQHLSAGDVRRIQDLYRCESTNQKPNFPVDVFCSFDKHSCGFKRDPEGTWSWLGVNAIKNAGYLINIYDSLKPSTDPIRSVVFHGLSPLDKGRGPEGCISFNYTASTSGIETSVSLKLFQEELKVALDLPLEENRKRSLEIWSITITAAGSRLRAPEQIWSRASIRVNILEPFKLSFVAQHNFAVIGDWIKVDDFRLQYAPCTRTNPTASGLKEISENDFGNENANKPSWLESSKSKNTFIPMPSPRRSSFFSSTSSSTSTPSERSRPALEKSSSGRFLPILRKLRFKICLRCGFH